MTVTINGTTGIVAPAFDGAVDAADLTGTVPSSSVPYVSGRNRIINGAMTIDQRNAGASVAVPINTVQYTVDRSYSYVLGAACTAQRVSSGRTDFPFALRVTGASSNTYCEIGQRIEAANCSDLVGGSVTVSFLAARSSGTSLTVRLFYAGSSDNFSSPTSIATQAFTISSTLTQYTVTFNALPAQTANGLQLSFDFGAVGSGQTVTLTGVQLEAGSIATPFERRLYGQELALCQRYCYVPANAPSFSLAWITGAAAFQGANIPHPQTMRATPTISGVTSFTIQGITASAVGFAYTATSGYLVLGSSNSNSQGDGVLRSVNSNQIPVISAEL